MWWFMAKILHTYWVQGFMIHNYYVQGRNPAIALMFGD